MIIDCNKKYINRRGEIYFDVKRAFEMETDCPIYEVRCIAGWITYLNERGEATGSVSKYATHTKNGLDIVKEYNHCSILLQFEILLRRIITKYYIVELINLS